MKMKMKANMSNQQYLRPKFGLMQMAMLIWTSKGIEEKMGFRENGFKININLIFDYIGRVKMTHLTLGLCLKLRLR